MAAILGVGALSGPAEAVIFDAARAPRIFEVDPALLVLDVLLFDALGASTGTSVAGGAGGTITLGPRPGPSTPSRPEGDVPHDGIAEITFEDILAFELDLTLALDTFGTTVTVTVPVTPSLGALDLISGRYTTDGTNLVVDASTVPTGTPLLQVTRDGFPTPLTFPNGQRYGDDVADQLLVQLVAGSVNLVTAALPDGISAPAAAVGFGTVTADNTLVLATARSAPPPSPVPLPGGLLLVASALAGLATLRRRR